MLAIDTDRKLCSELTADGSPCQGRADFEDGKCWAHSEHTSSRRSEAYAEGGRQSGALRRLAWVVENTGGGLKSPTEIVQVLESVVQTALAQPPSVGAMNVVISAARAALALYENVELAAVVEDIERQLKELETR